MWKVLDPNMPRNENEKVITDLILAEYDNVNPRYVEDCTHRNLFDIFDDHVCQPCKCGYPDCAGNKVENYCQPSHVVGMNVEFAEGDKLVFDESGLPLTENPNPLLPYDELIYNG